ncbi:hypothetical protein B0I33_101305 [Prauserella shujinwangii]|uniref:DUF308 domain-containing protein n=2 Tax=Prauserella shujinwangii TaxID=1453103 RepID=A0A2T0M364_9PSEU|nr:hypothetical protein B0I33_101305 [Prauserella shujinwangii]
MSGADGPEDVDATFEEIVAGLRAQGLGDDDRPAEEPPSREDPGEARTPAAATGPGWRESETGWDETMFGADPTAASDEEHYVPPEPPPLPKPRKGAFVVLLFFVLGLLLLISPGLIGIPATVGTPVGMLALATGIALLLLRVRQGPPDGADPDNGAQV